jgi:hypothetical protein
MQNLSPAGEHAVTELAQSHGFSRDAVVSLLLSVVRGNGTMAQFDHPEFGGSGQWMAGGMTMVSDLFNSALKKRIADLASELAMLVASDGGVADGVFQGQAQRREPEATNEAVHGFGDHDQAQHRSGPLGPVSLFVPPQAGESRDWWPASLGTATSHGAQNGVRYAYFAPARRLAIELNGRLTLYDTLDHEIGGFSQQQSRGGSLSFHSQHGLVKLADLPVVE